MLRHSSTPVAAVLLASSSARRLPAWAAACSRRRALAGATPCGAPARTLAASARCPVTREKKRYDELPVAYGAAAAPLPPWQPAGAAPKRVRRTAAAAKKAAPASSTPSETAQGAGPDAASTQREGVTGALDLTESSLDATTSAANTAADASGSTGVVEDPPEPPDEEVPLIDQLGPQGQPWPPLAKDVLRNLASFPSCLLLTRVGGFYESYFDQAPPLAALLGIKLASRSWGGRSVPMAGFPLAQLEKYLKLLVQDHGRLVAICDEFREVSSPADGIAPATKRRLNEEVQITRRVTRVVSPGTLIDERFLDPFSSNWILAVAKTSAGIGLAWLDVSTADFFTTTCPDAESLRDEVARIGPSEIVLESGAFDRGLRSSEHSAGSAAVVQLGELLEPDGSPLWEAVDRRLVHVSLCAPAAASSHAAIDAEQSAVAHLTEHLRARLLSLPGGGVETIARDGPTHRAREESMLIDANTLAALEIREGMREGGGTRGSLLSVVRRTVTKGGARLLGQWLTAPSTSLDVIHRRQALVALFVTHTFLREDLRLLLRRGAGDVSRGLQRISTGRNDEQDLLEVRDFIVMCERLVELLRVEADAGSDTEDGWAPLRTMISRFRSLSALGTRLVEAMDEAVVERRMRSQEALERETEEKVLGDLSRDTAGEDAPPKSRKRTPKDAVVERPTHWGPPFEHLIRPGASKALAAATAEYTSLRLAAQTLENTLRERYGDRVSLKFLLGQGFVVHFSDSARARKTGPQPEDEMNAAYRGRTTRTFYHADWTQIGSRLSRMETELRRLETLELQRLRQDVLVEAAALRRNVRFIDELDTLLGFAHLAQELNLVRPLVDDSRDFDVRDGRHLGVELGLLEQQRLFTPNNVSLSPTSRLHVISGPNMGGKSTYLRHAALMAILAQCGSFVPARAARLGIVDRVFSRVGARDDVSRDRSTFMVEMAETSEILRRATPRSLVIADEIGRGTTTETGVALAFATLHHLYHTNACRTLFATHLHELADMLGWAQEERRTRLFPHVDFFCSDMEELSDGSLVYCHRLRRGVNRESHGLQVAALAEMPPAALDVARATLAWLAHEKEQEQPPARGAAQRLAGGERRMLALDARLASAPVAAALSNTA